MAPQPSIKILVSCHKPVCAPESDVFLPVHVGSLGKNTIPGCQRDDEGDNISNRNFTFCEMSGQYWAWKNLEADYVGQCHYRRYFCFDGQKYEANDHLQIEDDCLSPLTIAKYHIDDEEAIRSALDGVDLIRAPYWSVRGVPTPCGPKKTIRDHMAAYGLVTQDEIDKLVDICREKQPEYADELVKYLNGNKYLGYNCFIMKRDLFDRLCEFEFSILAEFDEGYDYSYKTTTHKRICGYLGEILYSVFVAHVSKEGIKVEERPLVFFDATPAPPATLAADADIIDVVWRYIESTPAKFAIAVESMLRALDPNKRYRITLVCNAWFELPKFKKLIGDLPSNVELREAVFPAVDLGDYAGRLSEQEAHIIMPFLLPRLFPENGDSASRKVLWVEGCAFFQQDPALVIDGAPGALCAAQSVFLEKELNKPENDSIRSPYVGSVAGWNMLEASAIVCELGSLMSSDVDYFKLYCDCCVELGVDPNGNLKDEFKKYRLHKQKPGSGKDTFCLPVSVYAVRSLMLKKLGAKKLPFGKAYSVLGLEEVAAWANEETVKAYKTAKPEGLLLYAPETTPFTEPENPNCVKYWLLARQTSAYESLLMTLTECRPLGLKRTLFPVGSKRYKIAFKVASFLRGLR